MEINLDLILKARERLKGVVRYTELMPSKMLSKPDEIEVFIKTESLQLTGSFKLRGAYNKIATLTDEERKVGIVAASAGNHAQGVALAAREFSIPATIVMPEAAPLAKVSATRDLGASVVLYGKSYDDAFHYALDIQKQTGAVFIHPFDDPLVIAGQGSVGLEILEALPDVSAIIVPIGGGGLISGIATAVKSLHPNIKIIGVQAAGAASMLESMKAGHQITLIRSNTIADGISVKTPGKLTYDVCSKLVDQIVIVDEDEIANSILFLLEKCKIVSEGAGAVAVAALLHRKVKLTGKVVALVSGGNIDVNTLQRIIDRGLMKAGRLAEIHTVIDDRPGHLHKLLSVVSSTGANVVSIHHDRTSTDTGYGLARLLLVLETRDRVHLDEVVYIMKKNGYKILNEE